MSTPATHIPIAEHELRDVLRHIKHAVGLGHTRLTCGIPTATTHVTTRLRAMGFGVDCDHYDGIMHVEWSEK